jgi:ribonuclease HII
METLPRKQRAVASPLRRFYEEFNRHYELSIDEAGRGCLFGRVYIACVVLPKDPDDFSGKDIKDSKKFSSKKKIHEVASYIKEKAFAWHIASVDEKTIDNLNILQSVMRGMHECIRETIKKVCLKTGIDVDCSLAEFLAVIDGNYFTPYVGYDRKTESIQTLRHVTVEQGDATYMGIAAASILAKTARDEYVIEMCNRYPELSTRYALEKNMGYGTKSHLSGIQEHGISQWHRRTFGNACKTAVVNEIESSV